MATDPCFMLHHYYTKEEDIAFVASGPNSLISANVEVVRHRSDPSALRSMYGKRSSFARETKMPSGKRRRFSNMLGMFMLSASSPRISSKKVDLP